MSINEELKELVSALFDADGDLDCILENDVLESVTAEEFKEALIAEKEENRKWGDKILIRANGSMEEEDGVWILYKKWVELKALLGDEFDDFFDRMFRLTNTIGVWGGDSWGVRILPNNAILFRNHHRVIGIDDNPSGRINVNSEKAFAALKEIADYIAETKPEVSEDDAFGPYDERYTDFSILHHMGKGEGITWQMQMPEKPHATGQTVFFLSNALREAMREAGVGEGNLFLDEANNHMFEGSRSGIYSIRIYPGLTIVNGMYRASDDYDTLIENYASYFDGCIENEPQHTVLTTYKETQAELRARAENEAENDMADFVWCMPEARELIEKYQAEMEEKEGLKWISAVECFEKVMPVADVEMVKFLTEKLISTSANEMSHQLFHFQPWFSEDPEEPCAYGNVRMQFKETVKAHNGEVVVVGTPNYGAASDVDSLKEALNAVYYGMESYLGTCKVWVNLDIEDGIYGSSSELSDEDREKAMISWDDQDAIDHKLCEISEKMREMMEEYEEEDEEEFLKYSCEYGFRMIFALDDGRSIDFEDLHNAMNEMTEEYECSGTLYVPAVGLVQGYCEGELDTGNVNTFFDTGW